MDTIIKEFCDHMTMTTSLSKTTIEGYRRSLRMALRQIGSCMPSVDEVRRYMLGLRENGYSPSHVNNTSLALEKYMGFIGREIKLPRVKRAKSIVNDILTEGEIARMLAATKNSREKVIIAILAYSGIRNRELCNLRVGDVDMDNGILRVIGGKGGKNRLAYIPRECVKLISDYLKDYPREEDDYLITTLVNGQQYGGGDLRKLVRTIAGRVGIAKRVYPHLFRHSLACNLLARGASLMTIQMLLGHEHLQSTLIYVRSTPQRVQNEYVYFVPSYL